jgi:hypothetical protein
VTICNEAGDHTLNELIGEIITEAYKILSLYKNIMEIKCTLFEMLLHGENILLVQHNIDNEVKILRI